MKHFILGLALFLLAGKSSALAQHTPTGSAQPVAGPYRPAVAARGLVFFAGQTGLDPQTQRLVKGGVGAETHRILQTLQRGLAERQLSLRDVINVTVYLTDITQYASLNEVYRQYFAQNPPARTCVAVKALPGGAQVEITITAAQP